MAEALQSQPFWNGCRPADPFKRIARAERRVMLDICLNQLSDAAIEIIWLRYHYGLTYAQIGNITGMTDDAVAQMKHRVIERMRELLAAQGILAKAHI